MKKSISFLLVGPLIFLLCAQAHGGSATWNLNPTDNLWNTAKNWTPATVPNSETDVATFAVSNVIDVTAGGATNLQDADTNISGIVFAPDASAYTLITSPGSDTTFAQFINFYGAGIINNSEKVQNFITEAAPGPEQRDSGAIFFLNASSVGENVVITNQGSASSGTDGGWTRFGLQFADTPSAGKATFINEGGKVHGTEYGGTTDLFSYTTAEAATFINQPGVVDGAAAGHTFLYTGGNIGSSTFINNPATVAGAEGGWTEIDIGVCAGCSFIANGATSAGPQAGQVYTYGGAGYATFTAKGGQGSGAQGGLIEIHNIANSNQTVVTAEGGTNGGLGGLIAVDGLPSSLDQVQFQLPGNGSMDLSGLLQNSATIGSLSGEGTVSLAGFTLTIGANNLDTTFSGVIQNSGALGKTGTGALTLTGANTYSGTTTVAAGTLIVANQTGSGTGTGAVKVKAGTLGGRGIIAGTVTIGTGGGAGAFLAPATGKSKPAILTIQKALTFNANGTFSYLLQARGRRSRADQVIAKGVRIGSGAQFDLLGQVQGKLRQGTSFTVINNIATTPISGRFANLADGAILSVTSNNLQASYEGGDGNDLTLTVLP